MKKKTNMVSIGERALRFARCGWVVVPMHSIKDKKCSCS